MKKNSLKIFFKPQTEYGLSIVEFAIILPLFLLLLFAIIEFGVFMYDRALLTNATREGTRTGVLYGNSWVLTDPINGIYSFYNASCDIIKNEIKDKCQKSLVSFGSETLEDDDISIHWEGERLDETSGEIVTKNFTCANYTDVKSGDRIFVDVSYNFDFLFLSQILGGIPMQTQTVMRIE